MIFNLKTDGAREIVKNDINKKYLKSGFRLGGSIKGNKLNLYIEDDFGKHSGFMSECFYGNFEGGRICGSFRMSNYVFVLLLILFLIAVESIVMAVINGSFSSAITPILIVAAEILYIFVLKRQSKGNNGLISEYLSNL